MLKASFWRRINKLALTKKIVSKVAIDLDGSAHAINCNFRTIERVQRKAPSDLIVFDTQAIKSPPTRIGASCHRRSHGRWHQDSKPFNRNRSHDPERQFKAHHERPQTKVTVAP